MIYIDVHSHFAAPAPSISPISPNSAPPLLLTIIFHFDNLYVRVDNSSIVIRFIKY